MNANKDVHEAAAAAGVRLWMIAERLGITDGNFSRRLRRELPEGEKDEIFTIIRELGEEVNDNG